VVVALANCVSAIFVSRGLGSRFLPFGIISYRSSARVVCQLCAATVQVLRRSGNEKEKRYAEIIAPVRRRPSLYITAPFVLAPSPSTWLSSVGLRDAQAATICLWSYQIESLIVAEEVPLLCSEQVVARPHLLLVTLVLCNAASTEVGKEAWRHPLCASLQRKKKKEWSCVPPKDRHARMASCDKGSTDLK
jgi:hypothetical protein